MPPTPFAQKLRRLLDRPRLLVRTLRRQRVENVGHRDNSPEQRNRLASKAVGIAGTVEFLMMRHRNRRRRLQDRRIAALEQLETDRRVRLHRPELFRRQRARFQQDLVGNADLADIVHRCGVQNQFLLRLQKAKLPSNQAGIVGHALDMRARLRIAELGRTRHAEQQFLLAQIHGGRRLLNFFRQPRGLVGQFLPA